MQRCLRDLTFSRFGTTLTCDGRIRDDSKYRIASSEKNSSEIRWAICSWLCNSRTSVSCELFQRITIYRLK